MKNIYKEQSGITFIGYVFILMLVGFFVLIALKVVPIYLENFKVSSSLKSLGELENIDKTSRSEIEKLLFRRLNMNDVKNIKREHVEIKSEQGAMQVNVAYEVRESFMGNVDIVVSFDNSIKLKRN